MLSLADYGCPGHGPIHVPLKSAATVGFVWDPHSAAWCQATWLALFSTESPVVDAWRDKVSADQCFRNEFRGGSLLDQCSSSSHPMFGN